MHIQRCMNIVNTLQNTSQMKFMKVTITKYYVFGFKERGKKKKTYNIKESVNLKT